MHAPRIALLFALLLALGSTAPSVPQDESPAPRPLAAETRERIAERARDVLEGIVARGVSGASAALVLPDGTLVTAVAGLSDREAGRAMEPADRMLSGSVGKTYVTATAHHLVHAGELELDAPAESYFEGDPEWIERVPNAGEVTLRQLLRHTSGIPRYVFEEEFTRTLASEPDRTWRPAELLAYVFDDEPLFAPGEGWAYSDTNYIVVGMVIEAVIDQSFYEYAQQHLLVPHGLEDTVTSDRRRISGVVQGHVVLGRSLGVPERTLADGRFVFNTQFEWCGGGWASTPSDLARWAGLLYSGQAFDAPYLESLLEAVDAPALGPGVRYGLGAMLRDTAAGPSIGHDGFMPGYLATMGYWPDARVAGALQLNTDDGRAVGRPLFAVLAELARIAAEELAR